MKKLLFSISLFIFNTACFSQTEHQIDSLTFEICKTIEVNNALPDSLRVNIAFSKHYQNFFTKFPARSEQEENAKIDKIYFRLQKNCNSFIQILTKNSNNMHGWKLLDSAPEVKISAKECKALHKITDWYYIMPEGDKVSVNINNGFWIETFEDGTYSKLKYSRLSDCEFMIEFIESNHHIRKNLSNKGDKYYYGFYSKLNDAYEVWISDKPNDSHPPQSCILYKK